VPGLVGRVIQTPKRGSVARVGAGLSGGGTHGQDGEDAARQWRARSRADGWCRARGDDERADEHLFHLGSVRGRVGGAKRTPPRCPVSGETQVRPPGNTREGIPRGAAERRRTPESVGGLASVRTRFVRGTTRSWGTSTQEGSAILPCRWWAA